MAILIGGLAAKQWEKDFKDPLFWDGLPGVEAIEPDALVAIASDDTAARRVAAKLLGSHDGSAQALRALVTALDDRDAVVVNRALYSLEGRDSAEAARHLARLMRHADARIRACACYTAARVRFSIDVTRPPVASADPRLPGILDGLVACLDDKVAEVRLDAACALAAFGREARIATVRLTVLLDDRAKGVRMQAGRALVASEPTAGLVERILRDKSLRGGALRVYEPGPGPGLHPPLHVIPAIIDALADRDPDTVKAALNALSGLGPAAAPAARAIAGLLASKDDDVVWIAIGTLRDLATGAEAALPELAKALRDPRVAYPAADALAAIGPPAAPYAIAALRDRAQRTREAAVVALAPRLRDTPAALPALLAMLADPAEDVRHRTLLELHEHGEQTAEVIAAVRGLADDPSQRVRDAVAYVDHELSSRPT
jgi:HEAT repeat protein